MNDLLLTGLSTDFDIRTKETSYSLIFNGGELKIPVTEEAAELALVAMAVEEEEEEISGDFQDPQQVMAPDGTAPAPSPMYSYSPDYDDGPINAQEFSISTAGAEDVSWDIQNDPSIEGAEIFSATDDYAQPPAPFMPPRVPTGVDDTEDGVQQL